MKFFWTVIFILFGCEVAGQYYTSGSDPVRLRWNQVKTPVVRIVFEESLEKEALRLAAFIDSMAPRIAGTLGHSPRRVNLLIHNHTAYSNGFVSWAPRRTEFFSMPHQNTGSVDWLEHLAIHEYRHVVQIDKLNQGFTRFLSYFTGQQAVGGVLGMFLPMWFLEGDAVITETTLTESGRGRSFEFNNELKAQLLEKGKFSYDKAYLGSYGEHVPDYYKMGYLLTGMARREFGTDLWENAITNTGRNSWAVNPFNRVIKQKTGLSKKALYGHLFDGIKEDWKKEIESQTLTGFIPIPVPQKDYQRFMHTTAINDTVLIAELRGPGLRSQIVSIHILSGEMKTLAYTGIRENEPISANENLVVWSEIKYHPRWEHESWSVIRAHNLQTGKTKTLTHQTYLFSPAIHPNGSSIVAVEATPGYKFFLTFLNAETGKVLRSIPTPGDNFILTPSWNQNGENIVCIILSGEGKAIYTFHPQSEIWTQITRPGNNEIRHPVQNGNLIWYTAKGDYGDEVFSIDLSTNETTQITSSKFGAMYPAITPGTKNIIYSHYTSKGYHPVIHDGKSAVSEVEKYGFSVIDRLAKDLTEQETISGTFPPPPEEYKVERYSKWNLINFHSWAPAYADFERQEIYTGLSVMSQNLLGTAIITGGYNADPSAITEKYNLNITYRGFFPLIDFLVRKGDDHFEREGFFTNRTDTFYVDTNQKIDFLSLKAGLRIPLDLSKGNYSRLMSASSRFTWQTRSELSYQRTYYTLNNNNRLVPTGTTDIVTNPSVDFKGMEYTLYFHNLRRGTSRDVGTRFGQVVNLAYRHTPWGNIRNGNIAAIITRVYLPGFMKYHSLSVSNDYQWTNPGNRYDNGLTYSSNYRFSSVISYPRGYSGIRSDEMYVFRSTYMLPLWNPDASIGSLAYIKRLRMNLFFDSARTSLSQTRIETNETKTIEGNPASFGGEIHADTHILRFVLPFSAGYRIGCRSTDKTLFHEFIIRTGFGGFLVNNQ